MAMIRRWGLVVLGFLAAYSLIWFFPDWFHCLTGSRSSEAKIASEIDYNIKHRAKIDLMIDNHEKELKAKNDLRESFLRFRSESISAEQGERDLKEPPRAQPKTP